MAVEEEAVVDTIFLVSVIVEYMRRYGLCILLWPKTLEFPSCSCDNCAQLLSDCV
jgi:hypothetical protein